MTENRSERRSYDVHDRISEDEFGIEIIDRRECEMGHDGGNFQFELYGREFSLFISHLSFLSHSLFVDSRIDTFPFDLFEGGSENTFD